MKDEILAAVMFFIRFIEKSEKVPKNQIESFKTHLTALLMQRFEKHWFPEVPAKGQGYRCIRVNCLNPVDCILQQAAIKCGLRYSDLSLPKELTVWVDPREVCYRLGESEGSYCTLATFPLELSSGGSSPATTPPATPSNETRRKVQKRQQYDHKYKNSSAHASMTALRYKPTPREMSFNMHDNRTPWYCDGLPFSLPPAVYRNVNYNTRHHYKNVVKV